ncbi:hypothetical protein [Bacillus marinisedimentorum]|uniref:hypothetical protein n=1 Tax=Bacillus marinisedimentorum TaxID=1821260 RepID=UPI001470C4F2|nr:hypothetical protein [Bacillus marinisedimentorum]
MEGYRVKLAMVISIAILDLPGINAGQVGESGEKLSLRLFAVSVLRETAGQWRD